MRLAIGNILLCAGVLAFAIQWENWSKPNVIRRIVEAAKPDAFAYGIGRLSQNASQSRRLDQVSQREPSR